MADTGNIWFCKIGASKPDVKNPDEVMRNAVRNAYREVTDCEPKFIFSGWNGQLTEPERAVVENLLPVREATPPADAALADEIERFAWLQVTTSPETRNALMVRAAAALRARSVEESRLHLELKMMHKGFDCLMRERDDLRARAVPEIFPGANEALNKLSVLPSKEQQ